MMKFSYDKWWRLLLGCLFFSGVSQYGWAQSDSPGLDDIYQYLSTHYAQYDGITYDRPAVNLLSSPYGLLTTPNAWGMAFSQYNKSVTAQVGQFFDPDFHLPRCETGQDCQGIAQCQSAPFLAPGQKLYMTQAHQILYTLYDNITQARRSVDIMTYGHHGVSNGAFSATLKSALTVLGYRTLSTHTPITVRILEGSTNVFQSSQPALQASTNTLKQYLQFLTENLPEGNQLKITVANERSCQFAVNCGNEDKQTDFYLGFAFTHGKLVNIDGTHLLFGGENLRGRDYLETDPVIDLNAMMTGDVASGATIYANAIWRYVTTHPGFTVNFCYTYQNGAIDRTCADSLPVVNPPLPEPGNVRAMFISKLNNGVGLGIDANQSEVARVYAIRNAQHSIKISQQSIFFQGRGTFPLFRPQKLQPITTPLGNVIETIGYAIYHAHADVYIVTSSSQSSTKYGTAYSDNADQDYLRQNLLDILQNRYQLSKEHSLSLLKKYLHLAISSLSGSADEQTYQHQKFWMVDDKIFYIGSHNIYPASVHEFGVIMEGYDVVRQLLDTFWNPMWSHAIKKM